MCVDSCCARFSFRRLLAFFFTDHQIIIIVIAMTNNDKVLFVIDCSWFLLSLNPHYVCPVCMFRRGLLAWSSSSSGKISSLLYSLGSHVSRSLISLYLSPALCLFGSLFVRLLFILILYVCVYVMYVCILAHVCMYVCIYIDI